MKKILVKTSSYERFRAAITAVEQRGAPEASLLLVVGDPGFSKSIVVHQWAADNKVPAESRPVYLRAKVGWTPNRFLLELAEALGVDVGGRSKDIFQRITAVVGKRQMPIIIDEVQHTLANGARVLEAVRDISDLTETIIVLVAGEEQVLPKIARYPQISSRISKVVEFTAATLDDVVMACDELAEIKIDRDLATEIHRQSNGRMRDVIGAIAIVERTAKRLGAKHVKAADFAGKALVHDWQANRPRASRAGYGAR